jgi:hypothetical protein
MQMIAFLIGAFLGYLIVSGLSRYMYWHCLMSADTLCKVWYSIPRIGLPVMGG